MWECICKALKTMWEIFISTTITILTHLVLLGYLLCTQNIYWVSAICQACCRIKQWTKSLLLRGLYSSEIEIKSIIQIRILHNILESDFKKQKKN